MNDDQDLTKETYLTVSSGSTSFEDLIAQLKLSDQTLEMLGTCDVVLVPTFGYAGREVWCFPQGTTEYFRSLTRQGGFRVEASIEDEDYLELALHSDLLILPHLFVLSQVALPYLINITSAYIFDWLRGRPTDSTVRAKLTIQQADGTAIDFSFDGPATEYTRSMNYLMALVSPTEGDVDSNLSN